jgi:hypothetical protein
MVGNGLNLYKLLSQHLPGQTEKNYEISGQLPYEPKYELMISRLPRDVNHSVSHSCKVKNKVLRPSVICFMC